MFVCLFGNSHSNGCEVVSRDEELLFDSWFFGLCVSHSVVSDSLRSHGLQPTRLLCPWDSPGKITGVACHALFQEIFPTQGKKSVCNAGDPDSILGLGRSSGEGNDIPLQYSCLENPMDREPDGLQSMGFQRDLTE